MAEIASEPLPRRVSLTYLLSFLRSTPYESHLLALSDSECPRTIFILKIGTSIGLSLSSVLLDRTIASKSKSLGISVPSGGTAADSAPKEALLAGYRAAQWLCFAYVMVGLFLAVVFLRDIGIIAKKPPKASLHSASIHESEVDEEARFSEDKKEQRIDENSEDVKKTTPISTV